MITKPTEIVWSSGFLNCGPREMVILYICRDRILWLRYHNCLIPVASKIYRFLQGVRTRVHNNLTILTNDVPWRTLPVLLHFFPMKFSVHGLFSCIQVKPSLVSCC